MIEGREPRNGHRSAFTLAEVIAAVAIVAILAASTIPTVESRLAVGRGQALAKDIESLAAGRQAFNNNAGTYPLYLDELVALPASPNTYCGTQLTPVIMTAGQIASWKGPYVSRLITGDYVTADGNTVVDLLARTTVGTPRFLQITVNNVALDVATVVEEVIDGPGAERLLGAVSMHYLATALQKPVRVQAASNSANEV